ncbi:MAG: hypothetical protein QM733_04135 [Ilumatobacteraceae bacterium]
MRVFRSLALASLVLVAVACTSDDDPTPSISAADALTAIVDWQAGRAGPPATDAALPVIYVTSEAGTTIDAGTQAKVAGNTVDVAKVRFADARDDAVNSDVEGEPVRDDGVLLIVDELDGKGVTQMPVGVTVYRDSTDEQHLVLTVAATDDRAEVTASAARPSG